MRFDLIQELFGQQKQDFVNDMHVNVISPPLSFFFCKYKSLHIQYYVKAFQWYIVLFLTLFVFSIALLLFVAHLEKIMS